MDVISESSFSALCQKTIEAAKCPGIAALYCDAYRSFESAAGHWNGKQRALCSVDDKVRIGCLVKVLQAVQVVSLAEAKAFSLDQPLARTWPELDIGPNSRCMTARQLLTHGSGLVFSASIGSEELTVRNFRRCWAPADESELFLAEPGRLSSYSSLGYVILAYVAERLAERSWIEDLQARVLDPLGIEMTFRPRGHRGSRAPAVLPAIGGELALSARELLKLAVECMNLSHNRPCRLPLSRAGILRMLTVQQAMPAPCDSIYGFAHGWIVFEDGSVGFRGGFHGTTHVLLRMSPSANSVLAAVADYHPATQVFDGLWRAIQGEARHVTDFRCAHPIDICGSYAAGALLTVRVEFDGEAIRLTWIHRDGTSWTSSGEMLLRAGFFQIEATSTPTWRMTFCPGESSATDRLWNGTFFLGRVTPNGPGAFMPSARRSTQGKVGIT